MCDDATTLVDLDSGLHPYLYITEQSDPGPPVARLARLVQYIQRFEYVLIVVLFLTQDKVTYS